MGIRVTTLDEAARLNYGMRFLTEIGHSSSFWTILGLDDTCNSTKQAAHLVMVCNDTRNV